MDKKWDVTFIFATILIVGALILTMLELRDDWLVRVVQDSAVIEVPNTISVSSELCSIAVAKMLGDEWHGDTPDIVQHAMYSSDGELVSRAIIIYYAQPEEDVSEESSLP